MCFHGRCCPLIMSMHSAANTSGRGRRCGNGASHVFSLLPTLKKVHKACHYSKEVVILDLTQNIKFSV